MPLLEQGPLVPPILHEWVYSQHGSNDEEGGSCVDDEEKQRVEGDIDLPEEDGDD